MPSEQPTPKEVRESVNSDAKELKPGMIDVTDSVLRHPHINADERKQIQECRKKGIYITTSNEQDVYFVMKGDRRNHTVVPIGPVYLPSKDDKVEKREPAWGLLRLEEIRDDEKTELQTMKGRNVEVLANDAGHLGLEHPGEEITALMFIASTDIPEPEKREGIHPHRELVPHLEALKYGYKIAEGENDKVLKTVQKLANLPDGFSIKKLVKFKAHPLMHPAGYRGVTMINSGHDVYRHPTAGIKVAIACPAHMKIQEVEATLSLNGDRLSVGIPLKDGAVYFRSINTQNVSKVLEGLLYEKWEEDLYKEQN